MDFSGITDSRVIQAIKRLPDDSDFQQRFGNDSVLDELQKQDHDKGIDFMIFKSFYSNSFSLDNFKFRLMTADIYSFLNIIQSPAVTDSPLTAADVDLLVFLFSESFNGDFEKAIENSVNFCLLHGISLQTALKVIDTEFQVSFYPLQMLPEDGKKCTEVKLNADYLTLNIARVHGLTGYDPLYIIQKLPLALLNYYVCQSARMNGVQNIHQHSKEEILLEIDFRSSQLVIDRLIQLKQLDPAQKEDYMMLLCRKAYLAHFGIQDK